MKLSQLQEYRGALAAQHDDLVKKLHNLRVAVSNHEKDLNGTIGALQALDALITEESRQIEEAARQAVEDDAAAKSEAAQAAAEATAKSTPAAAPTPAPQDAAPNPAASPDSAPAQVPVPTAS